MTLYEQELRCLRSMLIVNSAVFCLVWGFCFFNIIVHLGVSNQTQEKHEQYEFSDLLQTKKKVMFTASCDLEHLLRPELGGSRATGGLGLRWGRGKGVVYGLLRQCLQ